MKRILSILILLLATHSLIWSQAKQTFNEKSHDFGSVLWNQPVTAEFKIKNTGNKPLIITNVTTSCGCTVVGWTKEPIAPGKEGTIKSTFDCKSVGRFYKTIGVYTNAAPVPVYLSLKGTVVYALSDYSKTHPVQIGDIRLDKDNIEFPDANRGDIIETEISVINNSEKPYEPVLMHLPPYLKAEAVPAKLSKGRVGKIKLKLDTKLLNQLGLTQTEIYLARYPGDKVSSSNEITVSAVLLPDFSHLTKQQKAVAPSIKLSSTELDMGSLAPNDKVSQTVIITNEGKSRLDIRELQVFNQTVNVSLRKRYIKPGTATKLKVTLYGKGLKKMKSVPKVLMITNDPAHPKVTIKIKATTK